MPLDSVCEPVAAFPKELNEDLAVGWPSVNSWTGNVCMEYVVDDARRQSLIRYAVFEKNSKFVNYDLGPEDIEDRCSIAGVDLTNAAEKELKDESGDSKTF
jgi:hypothetical protein